MLRTLHFKRYDYAAFSGFFAYASAAIVIPVALVSLARELKFSLETGGFAAGGALQFGRSIAIVMTMLLSGVLAGKFGKRKTFGYSVLFLFVGMLGCSLAPSYGLLFLALMIAGLGEGVVEALATPFVSDLHPEESGRYVNFTHSFWSVGILFTVLVSGLLLAAGVSWRLITFGVGALSLIPGILLVFPEPKGGEYPEHPVKQSVSDIGRHSMAIIKKKRFWNFYAAMFMAGGGEFCLTFWAASYIQLHFQGSAWAGGLGTAFFAGGMVLGRAGVGFFARQHDLSRLIMGAGLLGGAISLFLPHIHHLWVFFGVLMLCGLMVAPFWPSLQTYAVDRMREQDSTMMYILLSCAGIPGCGFFTLLMGYLGNHYGSLEKAFYLVPACFAAVTILVVIDTLTHERQSAKPPLRVTE